MKGDQVLFYLLLLMASFPNILTIEALFPFYSFLGLSPNFAFITLRPLVNLVFLTIKLKFLYLLVLFYLFRELGFYKLYFLGVFTFLSLNFSKQLFLEFEEGRMLFEGTFDQISINLQKGCSNATLQTGAGFSQENLS